MAENIIVQVTSGRVSNLKVVLWFISFIPWAIQREDIPIQLYPTFTDLIDLTHIDKNKSHPPQYINGFVLVLLKCKYIYIHVHIVLRI